MPDTLHRLKRELRRPAATRRTLLRECSAEERPTVCVVSGSQDVRELSEDVRTAAPAAPERSGVLDAESRNLGGGQ